MKQLDKIVQNLEPKERSIHLEENQMILSNFLALRDKSKKDLEHCVTEIYEKVSVVNSLKTSHLYENDMEMIKTEVKNKTNNFEKKWTEKVTYLENTSAYAKFKMKCRSICQEIDVFLNNSNNLSKDQNQGMDSLRHLMIKVNESEADGQVLKKSAPSYKDEIDFIISDLSIMKEKLSVHQKTMEREAEAFKQICCLLEDWTSFFNNSCKKVNEFSSSVHSFCVQSKSSECYGDIVKDTEKLSNDLMILKKELQNKNHEFLMTVKPKISSFQNHKEGTMFSEMENKMLENIKIINSSLENLESLKNEIRLKKKEAELETKLKLEADKLAAKAKEETDKAIEAAIAKVPPRPPTPELDPRPVAPIFTTGLTDLVISEGDGCCFHAEVSGIPEPIITWFKDGIPVEKNTDYISEHEKGVCKLTIEESMKEDSANWSVRASNKAGYSESHAKLTVKEVKPLVQHFPPQFLESLHDCTVKEGAILELKCKIDGKPCPSVSWYKNGVCIDKSKHYNIGEENGHCVLRIEKAYLEDASEFTCKISNILGQNHSVSKVTVMPKEPIFAPKFEKPLENIVTRPGDEIYMECTISGTPTPVITWFKDDRLLKSSNDMEIFNDGQRATLRIKEAYPRCAGTYICKGQNIAGEALTTSTIYFKARTPEFSDSETSEENKNQKPAFYIPLFNTELLENEDLSLECSIIGFPAPEITWFKENVILKESKFVHLMQKDEICKLLIKDAKLNQSGTYMVIAKNSFGECKSSCTVKVNSRKITSESQTQTNQENVVTKKANSYTHSVAHASKTQKIVLVESPLKTIIEPKFVEPIQGRMVEEGNSISLTGIFTGNPTPKITWLKENQIIQCNNMTKINNFKNKSSLVIDEVSQNLFLIYFLRTNKFKMTCLAGHRILLW